MLNLSQAKRIVVIGGGTAGWFSAIMLRKMFDSKIEVVLLESPEIGIIGVGEGAILNLLGALADYNISIGHLYKLPPSSPIM